MSAPYICTVLTKTNRLALWLVLLVSMDALSVTLANELSDAPPVEQVTPSGENKLSDYQVIIERTLFRPTRSPITSSGDRGGLELAETWLLVGIVIENNRSLALFKNKKIDKTQRLDIGMALTGDWRVEAISNQSATLINGLEQFTFELNEPRAPEGKPPADATPSPDTESESESSEIPAESVEGTSS